MHFESLKEYRDRFKIHAARLNQSFLAFVALFAFFIAISGAYIDYKRVESKRISELQELAKIQLHGTIEDQQKSVEVANALGQEVKELRDKELSVSLLGTSLPAKISLAGIMFSVLSVIWALFIRVERQRTTMLVGGFVAAAKKEGKGGLSIGECPFWLAPIRQVPKHEFLNPEGTAKVADVLESIGWTDSEHTTNSIVMKFVSAILVLTMIANVGITFATTGPIALNMELTTNWMTRVAVFSSVVATAFVGWLLYQELFTNGPSVVHLDRRRNLQKIMVFSGVGVAFVLFRDFWTDKNPSVNVEQIVRDQRDNRKKLAEVSANPRYKFSFKEKAIERKRRQKVRDKLIGEAEKYATDYLEAGEALRQLSPVVSESAALSILEHSTATPVENQELLQAASNVLWATIKNNAQRGKLTDSIRQLDLFAGLASRLSGTDSLSRLTEQSIELAAQQAAKKGDARLLNRVKKWKSDRWKLRWNDTVIWHHPLALKKDPILVFRAKGNVSGEGEQVEIFSQREVPI